MQIQDVMTADVSFVRPDTPILEIARKMREDDIGSTPVVENDRLVGMVTDRDIVVRAIADGGDLSAMTARDAMSPGVLYCFADETVEAVLENMGDQQIRRLPVVNREKRLVGIVSIGDIAVKEGRDSRVGDALQHISEGVKEHH